MAQQPVVLDEESSTILAELLTQGLYPDQETAIQQAFRALRAHNEEYEERVQLLRREVDKGFTSPEVEGDPFDRLRAKYGLPARIPA